MKTNKETAGRGDSFLISHNKGAIVNKEITNINTCELLKTLQMFLRNKYKIPNRELDSSLVANSANLKYPSVSAPTSLALRPHNRIIKNPITITILFCFFLDKKHEIMVMASTIKKYIILGRYFLC